MRLDVESFADFIQYYRHSYVKARTDHNTLYLVSGAAGPESVQLVKYVSGREVDSIVRSWADVQNMVMFGLPRLGVVAFKHELSFLYYRTVRNGSRGYNSTRIVKFSFNEADLATEGLRVETPFRALLDHPPYIHMALRREWSSWSEAASSLLAETPRDIAYALSFNFGAYLPSDGAPKLTYKDQVIGDIQSLTKVNLNESSKVYAPMIRTWISSSLEAV